MAHARQAAVLQHVRSLAAVGTPAGQSDGSLLRAFEAAKDQAAFAALVRRHGSLVLGVCRRALPNLQDAEDAFQATFLLLARKAAYLHDAESLAGWLHGVAYRMAKDVRRAANRRRRHEGRAKPMRVANSDWEVMWREVQAVLDEEIQILPAIYRDTFVLCCLENRSAAEAARTLGVKEGTVGSRLSKARVLLQRALGRRGVSLPAVLSAAALTAEAAEGVVPLRLVASTANAASCLAAGDPLPAGVVSANALALVKGAKAVLHLTKLEAAATLALLLTLAGAGVGLIAFSPANVGPVTAEPGVAGEGRPTARQLERPPADVFGDPLPKDALARLGTRRLHHTATVSSVSFSPDGKVLASAATPEDAVLLWNAADGKAVGRLTVRGQVCVATFSPDGKTLAVGVLASGNVGRIQIWDPASGKLVRAFEAGEKFFLQDLVFSPDGKVLASTRREPEGKAAIRLWEVATGRALHALEEHTGAVTGLAFSPGGETLASAGADGRIVLWDARTGTKVRGFKGDGGTIWSVAFASGGKHLLWSGNAGARLWAADTGREVRHYETPLGGTTYVAVSPDGKTLAATTFRFDGRKLLPCLQFWDIGTGKKLRHFDKPREELGRLAFSPDGKMLASTGNGGNTAVRLLDISTGKSFPEGESAGRWCRSVCFSPGGKTIVAGNCVWNAATGSRMNCLSEEGYSPSGFGAFSPAGKVLASTSLGPAGGVHLWDTVTSKHLGAFGGDQLVMTRLAYSHDGARLATTSEPPRPAPPAPPFTSVVQVWDAARRKELSRFEVRRDWPGTFALSGDGKVVAVDGYLDGSVALRDATTGREIRRLRGHEGLVNAVEFSPDGELLATGSADTTLCLWEVASGKLLRRLAKGHRDGVSALAFSPDGRAIASGGRDQAVCLWEAATGQVRRLFEGHQGSVLAVSFSPGGRRLVSGSDDGTALVWDVTGLDSAGRGEPRWSSVELEALWKDLGDPDARKAFRAVCDLAAAPKQTGRLLGQRLRPAARLDQATRDRIGQLIRDLDADSFTAREKATQALAEIGEPAAPVLREVLAGGPGSEVRVRLKRLLERLEESPTQRLRILRALEVLECSRSPETSKVLEELARGRPDAWSTRQAKASLQRSVKRSEGK